MPHPPPACGRLLYLSTLLLAAAPASGSWQLLWEDDFAGPSVNASLWNIAANVSEGGNQIELYTADNVYTTVSDDGRTALALRTRPQDVTWLGRSYNVTSGRVDTSYRRNITLGTRTEITARLQNDEASGIHTAHWLLGYGCWPESAEIDIMECQSPHNAYAAPGSATTWQTATSNIHVGPACSVQTKHTSGTSTYPHAASPGVNFTAYWTTFAVERNASSVAYFVNSTLVNHVYEGMPGWSGPVAIPQNDMYLILSQAYMAHRPFGDPPAWAWPVEQLVDAVRVYEWV